MAGHRRNQWTEFSSITPRSPPPGSPRFAYQIHEAVLLGPYNGRHAERECLLPEYRGSRPTHPARSDTPSLGEFVHGVSTP